MSYFGEFTHWLLVTVLKPLYFSGCLYVSGGAILEDGDGIELVQKYDSKTGEWTEVAGMLIPRSGSAACLLGGYIYVIGKTS